MGRIYHNIKYYISLHRAPTDVLPASQAVRCRAPSSNREASGGVSHAREETLVKRPKRTLSPKKKEEWRKGICHNMVKELEAIFRG